MKRAGALKRKRALPKTSRQLALEDFLSFPLETKATLVIRLNQLPLNLPEYTNYDLLETEFFPCPGDPSLYQVLIPRRFSNYVINKIVQDPALNGYINCVFIDNPFPWETKKK